MQGSSGPKITIIDLIVIGLFLVRFSAVMLSQKRELEHRGPPNATCHFILFLCWNRIRSMPIFYGDVVACLLSCLSFFFFFDKKEERKRDYIPRGFTHVREIYIYIIIRFNSFIDEIFP